MTRGAALSELTQAALAAEATARFGKDSDAWAFVCPNCGDIATPRDYPAQERGRTGQECVGRLADPPEDPATGKRRGCRYAAYGSPQGPWAIRMPDGHLAHAFALAAVPEIED